jgi:hypothetical protein
MERQALHGREEKLHVKIISYMHEGEWEEVATWKEVTQWHYRQS